MEETIRRRVTVALAVIISVAWSLAFLRDMLDPNYDIPPEITPLMMLVAGWCFVAPAVKSVKKSMADEESST